jgi:hypothetical protein
LAIFDGELFSASLPQSLKLSEGEVDGNMIQPLVHRGARRIAERAGQILGEPVTPDQVYQWKFKKVIRTITIGGNIAVTDASLVEDLTTGQAIP